MRELFFVKIIKSQTTLPPPPYQLTLFLLVGVILSWLCKSSSYSAIAEKWEVKFKFIGSFVSFSCSINTFSSNYTFLRVAFDELSGEHTGLGDFLPDSMFSLLGD